MGAAGRAIEERPRPDWFGMGPPCLLTVGFTYQDGAPCHAFCKFSAADALLAAAPELDEELVRASQEYLADQYQADAAQWGIIDQDRWDAFFAWVSEQGFAPTIEAGVGLNTQFIQ